MASQVSQSNYSHLTVPSSNAEKKRGYMDPPSNLQSQQDPPKKASRSNTLQFDHDFMRTPGTSRSSYMVTGSRVRVAGDTRRESNPNLDARRAHSGRRQAVSQEAAYARPDASRSSRATQPRPGRTVAHKTVRQAPARPAHSHSDRPDLSDVTDFHSVIPAQGTLDSAGQSMPASSAPRRRAERKKNRPLPRQVSAQQQEARQATQPAEEKKKNRPRPKDQSDQESLMHQIEPHKRRDPSKYVEGARLRGDDTVVGLDISRKNRTEAQNDAIHANVNRTKTEKKRRAVDIFTTVVTILIVFLCFTGLLIRNSQIATLAQSNAVLASDNQAISEEIDKRRVEIALQEDLSNVQERAAAIGMRPPAEDQVEYVHLEEDNEAASANTGTDSEATTSARQHESLFETFIDWLASVLPQFMDFGQ